MRYHVRGFRDSQQHAAAIAGWQQVYAQLGPGRLSSELLLLSGERFQIIHEVFDKRVVQYGKAPADRFCVSLATAPTVDDPRGKAASPRLLMLRGGGEFVLHAPAGMALLSFCVDLERLRRLAEIELGAAEVARLTALPALEVPLARLEAIRLAIFRHVGGLGRRRGDDDGLRERSLEETLMTLLLDLWLELGGNTPRRGVGVSAYLVRQSQALVLAEPARPPSVLELCERLNVSRRTLQDSFQREVGMPPVAFLRSLRLNAVRRKLASAAARGATVGDVAQEMGFSHLSHFAANYHQLFGEYPSETWRRA
ncbi:AraC family transcriptional regulator [Gammaproteobacteria bacterium MFB021]|nr:AraC family transcriptional regulator [Gammaproteobacteria bacterium MFB021]